MLNRIVELLFNNSFIQSTPDTYKEDDPPFSLALAHTFQRGFLHNTTRCVVGAKSVMIRKSQKNGGLF